jgi:hypothetical protein
MNKRLLFAALLLATSCWGQEPYTLPLEKVDVRLALPSMVAGGGRLYEAHRSFNILRFSDQLQVAVFDLATRKELKRSVITVPRVHGARAAEGFYLSSDGQKLVYAELHSPNLLLVLSANDLTEIRRTDSLPFSSEDRERLFAGFDESGFLCFGSSRSDRLRFIRMNLSNFDVASEVAGPEQKNEIGGYAWSPIDRKVWVPSVTNEWQEYTEEGQSTEERFRSQSKYGTIGHGAVVFDGANLLVFVGNLSNAGGVASYINHHVSELEFPCVPVPYSTGDVDDYRGAICATHPDVPGGFSKNLTSEFLLLKASGPAVVWRHPMAPPAVVADSNDYLNTGIQAADPLIYKAGSKLLVIAPTNSSELDVYEVTPGASGSQPTPTTH